MDKYIFVSELIITMPIKAAMWVHGNVVEVENPKPSLKVLRWGAGALFRETSEEKEEYWFHIPIPTPVLLDGVRPPLNKIFIYYTPKTQGKAAVFPNEVHIWDGGSKKGWFWSTPMTNVLNKEWVIDPPITIYYGLGISVHVVFGKSSAYDNVRGIEFNTAGADFITP